MISTPYALRLSLNLRYDRSWWTFAGRVLQEQSGGA